MCKNESIICGKNAVLETIGVKEINKIYVTNKQSQIVSKAKAFNIPIVTTDKKYLDKITDNANHQGIAASIAPIKYLSLSELLDKVNMQKPPLILILDEVLDVNNIGAILRVCDAFQIDGIIINKRRSAQITPKVSKISTGALNYVNIARVNNLTQAIQSLKEHGFFIANLNMDGNYIVNQMNYDIPLAIIIGGEDKGVTKHMQKLSDFSISIPMNGHVNSLNVSCAVSILSFCYFSNINCER